MVYFLEQSQGLGAGGGILLSVIWIVAVVVGLAGYFIPVIVAYARNHRQILPIFMLNFFAGWTVAGWVGALVWACMQGENHTNSRRRRRVARPGRTRSSGVRSSVRRRI